MEDLIKLVETSASSEVYSLLKRADEKMVTEAAYENPRFVEDVVREVAVKLMAQPNFSWFSVAAENFESIHNHSAYAFLEHHRDDNETSEPSKTSEAEAELPEGDGSASAENVCRY
jgi:GTP cyclohydrolase I